MVVDRHRQDLFALLLSNHILIQMLDYLHGNKHSHHQQSVSHSRFDVSFSLVTYRPRIRQVDLHSVDTSG
jgi:hypothetical protein